MNREQRLLTRQASRRAANSTTQMQAPGGDSALAIGSDVTSANRVDQSAVSPSQYRDDFGVKLTDEQYSTFKERETNWLSSLKEKEGELGTVKTDIAKAKKQLDSEKRLKEKEILDAATRLQKAKKNTIESTFKGEQKSWVPINVTVDGEVRSTYKLPKAALGKLKTGYIPGDIKTNKDGSVTIEARKKSGVNTNEVDINRSDYVDKNLSEINNIFRQTSDIIKSEYYKKALPSFQELQSDITKGYSQLNKAREELINSYNEKLSYLYNTETDVLGQIQGINQSRSKHNEILAGYKEDYAKRLADRKALFGVE